MKPFIILFLCCTIFSCSQEPAEISTEATVNSSVEIPVENTFDAALAAKYGADDYGMKLYVMALLYRGPNRDQDSTTAYDLQMAHMANINRLAEEGKLLVAGPFGGDSELRGIYIFDVPTVEEAEALTNTDPAIEAGSLRMELLPWYGSAAVNAIPDLHKKLEKIAM